MMSSSTQRIVWISVLFCWIVLMNRPWMVNGDLSCYNGSVDIVNGELNVESTRSIILQQCSEPPSPTTPTTATPGATNETTTATPGATNGTTTATPGATNGTTTATPAATNGTTTATPGATNGTTTATPAATNGTTTATSGATNGTTTATPAATNETTTATPAQKRRAAGSSVVGCVVTKSYQGTQKDNLTASFSCPALESPCIVIGYNGSTGEDNQTRCCPGDLCNTLDSFILEENISYSKVESCFVGTADAMKTKCGNSSNLCLTITETIEGGNVSYYCGNDTLQIQYCERDGALREGDFKQEGKNITARCCGSTNCNTPSPRSTNAPPPTATSPSTAAPSSTASPPSTGTPSLMPPLSTDIPPSRATPPSSKAMPGSTAIAPSTGGPQTSSAPSATARHSNKTLVIGIVAAFVVGLLGGVIVTVICCRRRKNSVARPGELLAFDSFHYKRMGADEIDEEVFMS